MTDSRPKATKDYWTDEKLDNLDSRKLQNVRTNAQTEGRDDIVARCDTRLAAMKIRKGGKRSGKSDDIRILEAEGDGQLVSLATNLKAKYDLSQETAKAASGGVKGYRARNLLGKKGASKVGGHQVSGKVLVDRYISYGIGEHTVGLGLILAKEQPLEAHKWFVSSVSQLLPERVPIQLCVPGMDAIDDNKNQGIAYDDFQTAAGKFTELIDQIAPKQGTK
ncbi:hypothetical protein [Parasphingorhabdus sp.]|uniref:hypothetical protein n=1 Tax=Parasphingorhabdus sp. TaxID=2709688 RepID=UPI003003080C